MKSSKRPSGGVTAKEPTQRLYLKKEHFIKTKCLFTKQEITLLLEKVLYLYKKGRIMKTQPARELNICIAAAIAYYTVESPSSFTLLHYNKTDAKKDLTREAKWLFGKVEHGDTIPHSAGIQKKLHIFLFKYTFRTNGCFRRKKKKSK